MQQISTKVYEKSCFQSIPLAGISLHYGLALNTYASPTMDNGNNRLDP
jgi:hypothetical protein